MIPPYDCDVVSAVGPFRPPQPPQSARTPPTTRLHCDVVSPVWEYVGQDDGMTGKGQDDEERNPGFLGTR